MLVAYWPYLAAVFAVGAVVGWWAEGTRDSGFRGWFERGQGEA
jgi:hypothetical protein